MPIKKIQIEVMIMSSWSYYNPVNLYAAAGCSKNLQPYLNDEIKNCLFVTTQGMLKRGQAYETIQSISSACHIYTVSPNPELDTLDSDLAALSKQIHFDAVIALGGGSVMDAAKALACGLAKGAPSRPLHSWLRQNEAVTIKALPIYCIPSTAGTGSEVTSFATIWDSANNQKLSLKHHNCYAKLALLDYELTLTLPWQETLIGALDALSHALETLWNKTATPCSVSFALGALELIYTHLPLVEKDLQSKTSRKALQDAATLAGFAISQSHSSIAHAISYPLTLNFDMPHGFACSALLPAITAFVTQKNAWHPMVSADHYKKAHAIFEQYSMSEIFARYTTVDEALKYIDEMFTPARANTFATDICKDDVIQFFKNSLK